MDTSRNTLSQQELDEVINQHHLWLETDGKEGQRADLSRQRLVGLNLSGAILEGAILVGANLSGANLSGANLSGAILEGAILEGVILVGAILEGARLSLANLEGARLFRANLSGANLWGTILDNTDITVARNWQQAIGISTTPTDNLSQKLQQQNQEIEQLKAELEAAKASEQAGGQDAEKISRLEDKLAQAEKAKGDIENRLNKLEKELEQKNKILSNQIDDAQTALAETFKNSADKQIKQHGWAAAIFGYTGGLLILADGYLIYRFLEKYWFNPQGDMSKPLDWSFAVYSFPVLIILVLATTLLRHQKKLLDEVRHFAAVKQQIELYSGLLKASQHAAAHLNDPDESAKYVQETFSQIRTKLLQHNFTAAPTDNKDGDTSSGVDKFVDKLLEKVADTISKSGNNAA